MVVLLCIAIVALVAMVLFTVEADMADDRNEPTGLLTVLSVAAGLVFVFALIGFAVAGLGLP